MNIRIITASAGSGKTFELTEILDEAIASKRVRPEAVAAVTFTKQAAAELIERARSKLLQRGRALDAHRLLAARIGTVNAVCGALVADHAFALGLSPDLRVLDEGAAELEFRRAIGRVVTKERAEALHEFKQRFEIELDWSYEVRRVVEAARANGLDAAAVRTCATRSKADLDACLGAVTKQDLDAALAKALARAIKGIQSAPHTMTKGTEGYLVLLRDAEQALERGTLRWGHWAKLGNESPTKKFEEHADPVIAIASRHAEHPRLRAHLHELIDHVFDIAANTLEAYQEHKRALGVIDFIDQETLALELLRRPDVREAMQGQLDLFLVDEFQDTSPIQLAVFLEFAALAKETIWVGDPKQAIFGFRGTDPALMDAAIESLTSVTTDGDFVAAATGAIARGRTPEKLSVSYRSRPGLVNLTSEMFAGAFESQRMDPAHVRLTAKLARDPKGLGDLVQYWPLVGDNHPVRAQALAAGVQTLLEGGSAVRDREDQPRPARRGDIAVLCRTNALCQLVATAFAQLGIPAVVPRMGLVSTHEAIVALAGLTLWADPRDAVAAAELARVISYPEDLDGFVARVLATPGRDAFAEDAVVARVLAAREREGQGDLGPLRVLDAVLEATELRRLCAEWGDATLRLSNLDALRAHAVKYTERARSAGEAATLVGLIAYFGELASEGSWRESRTDSQALLAGEDAVTISTWHAAKGLEWPITVLFGLEALRKPSSWGVHVLSERATFVVDEPLAGRWIRYWPNPYTTSNQGGPVRDAVEGTAGHAELCAKAGREALRVLYVGWTRARDRIVLAAQPKNLLAGILSTLTDIDPALITAPAATEKPAVETVTWAGVKVKVTVMPVSALAAAEPTREPGEITTAAAEGGARVVARMAPSEAVAVPCTIGEVVELGPRLMVRNSPDMEHVGHAVHAFLAADRPGLAGDVREALAEELLVGHGVGGCLTAAEVVEVATRFWAWCERRFPSARLHREWPVAERTAEGTFIAGTADLVLALADGLALIDHKTFPGALEKAEGRAMSYSGQLAAYARAVGTAVNVPVTSAWIHFPCWGG